MKLKVIEPLQKLQVLVSDKDSGVNVDITFDGFTEVLQEPQMFLYDGPRKTMDTCRMVQHGSWVGQIKKRRFYNRYRSRKICRNKG